MVVVIIGGMAPAGAEPLNKPICMVAAECFQIDGIENNFKFFEIIMNVRIGRLAVLAHVRHGGLHIGKLALHMEQCLQRLLLNILHMLQWIGAWLHQKRESCLDLGKRTDRWKDRCRNMDIGHKGIGSRSI